ncbi:low-density lipoprotein receptor class A domain-containing protein 4 isoform X1 [Phacochoerus africanus]|uniref:low-density lipoprotein receptor class A domain-containing protein 4 isoform X1 n=1 Tax=Phacochoerus africanus TaxID=41426 RepID=UPI001FD9DFF6|nr:low-density lipoprotein receptor class A domain-containing protein 4 isoform X1 [Phacochoerus africanus]XP_047649549.1 low-density lipoprotein receptor class A domain-containing protein 4 isoform X1 [Phacochoerus africanus]XP_047649550.1 low-density lipoprotein receptor class A domain-containing protein 4 isoform X1 [Phacochoerus africanus]XP_047649551.1 low-density lipoprotein receptor class A domain-containing protein 4 isoform X1 [Phacochoerus africanus]XP_047649552.1 low-density lipoprot
MQEAGLQATSAVTECTFTCTSGQCLYLGSLVCNQQNDCGDNSDEENCLLVTEHPPPGIFSSQLELAQVLVVVVVVTVMVVVIVCLLHRYRVSSRSFIQRQRPEAGLQSEGRLWPSDGSGPRPASELMFGPRFRDGVPGPAFLQRERDRFGGFQPTYPFVQRDIDLPPTISLSDGEEPPPYQGPCALQLRDPEQQLELNRESVRAPPNRTIFDSDGLASVRSGGPCPPSSHSGISASTCSSHGRMEGPPPPYSEAMGCPRGSAPAPPRAPGSIVPPAQGKDRKPGDLA